MAGRYEAGSKAARAGLQQRTLRWVLLINGAMVPVELGWDLRILADVNREAEQLARQRQAPGRRGAPLHKVRYRLLQ